MQLELRKQSVILSGTLTTVALGPEGRTEISRLAPATGLNAQMIPPQRGGGDSDAHGRTIPPPLPGRIRFALAFRWLTPTG
jgi:hypothetical protein